MWVVNLSLLVYLNLKIYKNKKNPQSTKNKTQNAKHNKTIHLHSL